MAVGVPDQDVFAAADAVLARGERPTVERVRLELGRGSPARVGALLDKWWSTLAQRLRGETRLPSIPAEVTEAFVEVWKKATQHAQSIAEQGLSEQRAVIESERVRIATVEDEARLATAQARQQTIAAQAAQQASETRLADLEILLADRQLQIDDLLNQRTALLQERTDAHAAISQLRQEIKELLQQQTLERENTATYVRSVEDRAHQEVDRARMESRDLNTQLKAANKQQELLRTRLESMQIELSQAHQLAAAESVRAATLAQQIDKVVRSKRASTRVTKRPKKTRIET